MSDSILLYSRSTSSASYRVRIALNLKQQKYDTKTMGPAEQHHKSAEYLKINPQGLVPLLFHKSGTQEARLNQSVAIMEYLQEVFPKEGYALLPGDTLGRARVRSLALHIACEMQPLNNSGPVKYLRTDVKASADTVTEWSRHWAEKGFTGLEAELASSATGNFCHGDSPTMADCCLVPQVSPAFCTMVLICIFQTIFKLICLAATNGCNYQVALPAVLAMYHKHVILQ